MNSMNVLTKTIKEIPNYQVQKPMIFLLNDTNIDLKSNYAKPLKIQNKKLQTITST